MKKTIHTLALLTLVAATNAQTNTLSITNAEATGKEYGGYELTFGGGGTSINGANALGLDVSLSTNPFKARPEIWLGLAQGLYWEPTFAGSTDLFVDWSQNIWKEKLYLNVGWSGGAVYDNADCSPTVWRTGPEATVQYYTSGNAFIYAGVNYDVYQSDKQEGNWRYSFGIGFTF